MSLVQQPRWLWRALLAPTAFWPLPRPRPRPLGFPANPDALHGFVRLPPDLKAQNVLLKSQPGSGRLAAKVADFGLSFRMDDAEQTHATKGQLVSATPIAPCTAQAVMQYHAS